MAHHKYVNQTALGKMFDLSAIHIGKILIQEGFRDPITKQATKYAIDNGFAKSSPLKDGTPFYMWHTNKIKPFIIKHAVPLTEEQVQINKVKDNCRAAHKLINGGQDKMAYFVYDCRYEEINDHIKKKIYGVAELEVEIEMLDNKNFDNGFWMWAEDIINKRIDAETLEMYINAIKNYHPKYNGKLEQLLLLK